MENNRGVAIDRRSEKDRRTVYNLDYFVNGGMERRVSKERRGHEERRTGWVRVSKWSSVFPFHKAPNSVPGRFFRLSLPHQR